MLVEVPEQLPISVQLLLQPSLLIRREVPEDLFSSDSLCLTHILKVTVHNTAS